MIRQVNYLRHQLSSRQALSMLLRFWAENRSHPIILITGPGQAAQVVKQIRVTLSKERSYQVGERVEYGFIASEPFPFTDEGVKGEAIVIRLRLTQLQRLRNFVRQNKVGFQRLEQELKND